MENTVSFEILKSSFIIPISPALKGTNNRFSESWWATSTIQLLFHLTESHANQVDFPQTAYCDNIIDDLVLIITDPGFENTFFQMELCVVWFCVARYE